MRKEAGQLNRKPLYRHMLFVLAGIVVVATIIVSSLRMIRTIYEERSTNTQILVEQVARNLDESLAKELQFLEYYANNFEHNGFTSLKEAQDYLALVQKTGNENIISMYLIDKDAYCYSSDEAEKVFRWRSTDVLASGKPGCFLSTVENTVLHPETAMFFITPFQSSVKLDEATMTHMVMEVSMDVVDSYFNIAYYGDGNTSLILRSNGSQAYIFNGDKNGISQAYNILVALKDAKYYYGASKEQLETAIAEGQSGCMYICWKGEPYYLVYEPFGVNDWMAVMMIEESHISGASNDLVRTIVITVGFIAVIAVITIVSGVVITTRAAKRRLEVAAEAEKSANEAKTRFLSAMSHDIRTPMNAVIGMSNLAMAHISNQEYVMNCLTKVKISAGHLLTLINDVLDISKVEAGKMRLNPTVFSLEDEVECLVEITSPQINEKEQEFVCNVKGLEGKMVYADKLRINQIMLNLLSNAVKYTPVGGRIELDVCGKPADDNGDLFVMVYQVKDNGIGMSDEFQKNMYDIFAREENELKRDIQGSGLGLAICKQMVELMNGTIECESVEGKGTTFTVTLTLQRKADRELSEYKEKIQEEQKEKLSDICILIAEDNDFNWEIASEVLKAKGIDARRAENGQRCVDMIAAAKDGEYAMILMDIQMPVLNGYQAAQIIRASQREYLRTIPIIAVTADAFSEDVQRCLEVGMNEHLSKPIDVGELIKLIRKFHISE